MILNFYQRVDEIRSDDIVLPPILYRVGDHVGQKLIDARWLQKAAEQVVKVGQELPENVSGQHPRRLREQFPASLAELAFLVLDRVHVDAERAAADHVGRELRSKITAFDRFAGSHYLVHVFL